MKQIKTDEEMARLDAIFAEIEAAERGEPAPPPPPPAMTQERRDEANRRAKIDRLAGLDRKEFIGNVKANIGNDAFKTKWEKILSKFIMDTMAPMNAELNALRNFAHALDSALSKAERTAREQDNHHYYKMFAEHARKLLDKL